MSQKQKNSNSNHMSNGVNPYQLTVAQAIEKLRKREISSQELIKAFLGRIDKVDKKISAFISINSDLANEQARKADEKIAKGEKFSPLTGIPIAVKDNILTEGLKTTAGSKILENYLAPYDATVIKKIKAAGAILIGKANLDEFAMGSSTENSAFKKTKNPWDLSMVPGGSSGGPVAAVAADECLAALGSDTGGSIRQPASFCGAVGLKPTYGRVSRWGLIAMASSLDQIGPVAKTVADSALLLNIISGKDSLDSTSLDKEVPDYTKSLTGKIKGIKIGIPDQYFSKGIDREVEKAVKGAISKLEQLGAKVDRVSLPMTEYALAAYYIIMPAEASANLARYDGIKYGYSTRNKESNLMDVYLKSRGQGFGDEVRRRIMLGTYALSAGYYEAYYLKAQKVRTKISEDFKKAFKKFDLLVTPTSPTTAFKIGEKIDDPLKMYLSDIYTVPVNLAGLPAISLPCGFVGDLPVGLQIIGPHFSESQILQTAYAYEQNTDWHLKKPKI